VSFAKDDAFEMTRWLGAEGSFAKGEAFEMATGKFEGGTDFCGTCPQKVSGGKSWTPFWTSDGSRVIKPVPALNSMHVVGKSHFMYLAHRNRFLWASPTRDACLRSTHIYFRDPFLRASPA
jgi:hypothetical protein